MQASMAETCPQILFSTSTQSPLLSCALLVQSMFMLDPSGQSGNKLLMMQLHQPLAALDSWSGPVTAHQVRKGFFLRENILLSIFLM